MSKQQFDIAVPHPHLGPRIVELGAMLAADLTHQPAHQSVCRMHLGYVQKSLLKSCLRGLGVDRVLFSLGFIDFQYVTKVFWGFY